MSDYNEMTLKIPAGSFPALLGVLAQFIADGIEQTGEKDYTCVERIVWESPTKVTLVGDVYDLSLFLHYLHLDGVVWDGVTYDPQRPE